MLVCETIVRRWSKGGLFLDPADPSILSKGLEAQPLKDYHAVDSAERSPVSRRPLLSLLLSSTAYNSIAAMLYQYRTALILTEYSRGYLWHSLRPVERFTGVILAGG